MHYILAILTLCWFRILAKLWAFNFGHPCPSLVKCEVLSPEKIRATTGGIAPYPHQPSKDLTIPRKSPSPLPFNERSVISHPHYPSRFSYCNRLYALICFHIRTIPPTFRRVRVCVCLVGFASLQSPWAHTLRHPCLFMNALLALRPCKAFGRSFQASLPCLLLPLHQSLLFTLIFAKEHLSLALLAPPVVPNTAIPHNHCKRTTTPRSSPTLPKPHYPPRFS